jgi:hypothetical protein
MELRPMDTTELIQAARLTQDSAGNPVVVLPLPVWEALLEEIQVEDRAPEHRSLNDLAPLSIGRWPEGLQLVDREEYYGDDGR